MSEKASIPKKYILWQSGARSKVLNPTDAVLLTSKYSSSVTDCMERNHGNHPCTVESDEIPVSFADVISSEKAPVGITDLNTNNQIVVVGGRCRATNEGGFDPRVALEHGDIEMIGGERICMVSPAIPCRDCWFNNGTKHLESGYVAQRNMVIKSKGPDPKF